MMDWTNEKPLIETLGWQADAGVHVTKALWCGKQCGFALGDGSVLFADQTGETGRHAIHDGACLAAALLTDKIVTTGDDGKVVATSRNGESETLFDQFGRFIDQVATAHFSAIAFSDAKRIYVLMPDRELKEYRAESTVGGLAFSSKGRKLAVSHNNGASVYWIGTDRSEPDNYVWKGAHGLISWSPRGDFIVTSMHENALHVWHVERKREGRMGGYPTRIKSFSWDHKGVSLATSGADGLIIWPFGTSKGPIGQTAEQIPIKAGMLVNHVAFHPASDVIAAGTAGGDVLLVRRDGAIMPVAMGLGSAITTLSWADKGRALAFGADKGAFGVVDFSDFAAS